MNIVLVTAVYLPTKNGVTTHLRSLKDGLKKLGHEVWIVSPENNNFIEDDHDIRIDSFYNPVSKKYPIAIGTSIPKIIKNIKIDVVHMHHPFGDYGLSRKIAEKNNCPLVFTNHTQYLTYVDYYLPLVAPIVRTITRKRLENIYKNTEVIASTKDVIDSIQAIYADAQTNLIPVGIDDYRLEKPSGVDVRKELGIKTNDFLALFVGRVAEEKSIDALVSMAQRIRKHNPNFYLVLAGGIFIPHYKVGNENGVIFIGEKETEELADYYNACDLFVSASVSETLGLTFAEAAFCGAPLLGIDSVGVRDIVGEDNGELATDESDFEKRLKRLSESASLRNKYEKTAKVSANKYTSSYNIKLIEDLYIKIAIK